MRKTPVIFAGALMFAVAPLTAQEAPTHVYEAYYAVSGSGMSEWNRQYREYAVPVLQGLVDEGVIEGFGQYQHQTGGDEYNVRFVARTHDWASLETFWSEYLSRLREVTPDEDWDKNGRIVNRHRDEIWDIQEVHFEDAANPNYTHMYASTFLVNFSDMAEFDEIYAKILVPTLEEARQEGMLVGWVKLGHNTGGPHNVKLLYFVDGWDDIDDMFMKLGGTIQEQYPSEFARLNEIMSAHDDNIWVPTSTGDM